jgi:phosphoribosylcarboxyaminoimidazole (NCAIR) mutase
MAVRILALNDESLREKLNAYIRNMAWEIEQKQESVFDDMTKKG